MFADMFRVRTSALVLIAAALCGGTVRADEAEALSTERREAPSEREPLHRQAVDPSAPLLQLELDWRWTMSFHQQAGDAHELTFQTVIPYNVWNQPNLFRLKMPYDVTSPAGDRGLAASEFLNLLVYQPSWGRWALGGVALFAPSGRSEPTFKFGPAAALVANTTHWKIGLFVRNFFSPSTAETAFQPVLAFTVNEVFSLSVGSPEFTLDWNSMELRALPLSLQLNALVKPFGESFQLSLNPIYQLLDRPGSEAWSLTLKVTLLLPERQLAVWAND